MKRCEKCEHFNKNFKHQDKCLCNVKGQGYVRPDDFCLKYEPRKPKQLKML